MEASGNRMTKYVMVTTVLSYRMRYMIPVDELQRLNPDVSIEGREISWAFDSVASEEAKEFSQLPIGEHVVDGIIITEDQMLEQFDKDNSYLKDWTNEQKIEFVKDWRFINE